MCETDSLQVHYEQGTGEPWGFQKLLGSQKAGPLSLSSGSAVGPAGSVPSTCDEPALSLAITSDLILWPGGSGSQ